MKKQILGALVFGLLVFASGASAQVWTAVGASGAIRHSSTGLYATTDGALFFRSGAVGNIWATYDVTNPRDTSTSPSWTTLEFTARNPGGGLGVLATATLYRQPRFSGTAIAVCTAIAPATGALSTSTCTFSSSTFDFTNNYYFVVASLGRETTAQSVTAWGLRIF